MNDTDSYNLEKLKRVVELEFQYLCKFWGVEGLYLKPPDIKIYGDTLRFNGETNTIYIPKKELPENPEDPRVRSLLAELAEELTHSIRYQIINRKGYNPYEPQVQEFLGAIGKIYMGKK
ncbi:MAG: hypothetical protein QXJ06_00230 [Candidatus Aenigmatarchaeota archaeon]